MKNTEDANAGSLHPVVRNPAFDADGYPTAETLQHIADWPYTDFKGLLDYVRPAVEGYGRMWEEKGAIKLATGGWSGNESIVYALQENRVFWAMCWESSHRGGLTVFRMPNEKSSDQLRKELSNKTGYAHLVSEIDQLRKELTESRSWVRASMESTAIAASTIALLTQQRDEARLRLNKTIRHVIVENDWLRKMVDAFAENGDCGDEWLMADYRDLPHVRARKAK